MNLVIFVASLSLLAVGTGTIHADQTSPSEVKALRSAEFTTSKNGHAVLKFSYATGGCGSAKHKTLVDLELTDKQVELTETLATVRIHIMQMRNGNCRMAYTVEDAVDLDALANAQAANLEMDFSNSDHPVIVKFVAPPVANTAQIIGE